jgi:hypothetical protein
MAIDAQVEARANALREIEVAHAMIHDGNSYIYSDSTSIANGATLDHSLKTGAKSVHFGWSVQGDYPVSIIIYEGPFTSITGGSALTPVNRNRISSNTSSLASFLDAPTVTLGSPTTLFTVRPGGAIATLGGSITAGEGPSVTHEFIFKPNTDYVFRVTNASAQANNVSIQFYWYEL